MDALILISLFIIGFLLLIGIPIGLSIIIYKIIKKYNFNKKLRIIALIPVLTIIYFIFTAIYPNEDFYKDNFKEVTEIEFPDKAKFLYKSATYPDHFGDYSSVSLIKVDKDFYSHLHQELINKGFEEPQDKFSSDDFETALKKAGDLYLEKELSLTKKGGYYYYVGFLSDKQSLIINRISW